MANAGMLEAPSAERLTLDRLRPGQSAVIRSILATGTAMQRLLEMGMTEGEPVAVLALAPLGDPMEIRVRDFELSLRKRDAASIAVDSVSG